MYKRIIKLLSETEDRRSKSLKRRQFDAEKENERPRVNLGRRRGETTVDHQGREFNPVGQTRAGASDIRKRLERFRLGGGSLSKNEGALFGKLKSWAKAFKDRRKGGSEVAKDKPVEVERLAPGPKSTSSQRGPTKKAAWSDEKRNFKISMGGDPK